MRGFGLGVVALALGAGACASGSATKAERELDADGPWFLSGDGVVLLDWIDEAWLAPTDEPPEVDPDDSDYGLEVRRAVVSERLPEAVRALTGREIELHTNDGRCCGRVTGFEALAVSRYAQERYYEALHFQDGEEPRGVDSEELYRTVWQHAVLVAKIDATCVNDWPLLATTPGGGVLLEKVTAGAPLAEEVVRLAREHGFVATQELDYHDDLEAARAEARRYHRERVDEAKAAGEDPAGVEPEVDPTADAPATWDSEQPSVTAFVDASGRARVALVVLGNHFACAVPPAWFVVALDDGARVTSFGVGRAPERVALIEGRLRLVDRFGDGSELLSVEGSAIASLETIERDVVECSRWGGGIGPF